jgi:hypothetical protein
MANIGQAQSTITVIVHFHDDVSGIFDGQFANGIGGSLPEIRLSARDGADIIARVCRNDRMDLRSAAYRAPNSRL